MVAFPSHHKTRSGKHCSEKLSSYYILFVMIHDNKAYRSSRCLGEGFDREIFRCERAHLTYKFATSFRWKQECFIMSRRIWDMGVLGNGRGLVPSGHSVVWLFRVTMIPVKSLSS